MAATTVTPNKGVRTLHWGHVWTVARTDLKQLAQARDYWIPMLILGGIFFVFVPTVLLFTITQLGNVDAVSQLSQALEVLPERAQAAIQGDTEQARAGYALAVYLFAPVAVVVPITISTAVGAATIVGERERGTGEFLAHSPAGIREIFLGKLAASLVPGYATTIVGFGIYALIVNTIVGSRRGRLVLPHQPVVGAHAVGRAAVPRPHPLPRAAAVGQGEVDRRRAAGVRPREPPADHGRLQPGHRQPLRRERARPGTSAAIAWVLAGIALWRGVRVVTRGPPPRRRRRAVAPPTGRA